MKVERSGTLVKKGATIFTFFVLAYVAVYYSVRHLTGVEIYPGLLFWLDSPVPQMKVYYIMFIVWITALVA